MVTSFFHIEDGGIIKQEAAPIQNGMPGTGPALQYFCLTCQKFVTPKDVTDDRKKIKVPVSTPPAATPANPTLTGKEAEEEAKRQATARAANPVPGDKIPPQTAGPQAPPASSKPVTPTTPGTAQPNPNPPKVV
jgi:hypothetical protein